MNNASQNAAVLRHMETRGAITQADAWNELGCSRLPARIAELRKLGFDIADEWQKNPTTGKRWKAYRLR